MTGAAFFCSNRRARNQIQDIACFYADILHTQVAGDLVGDIAELLTEIRIQRTAFMAQLQVFKGVIESLLYLDDIFIIGKSRGSSCLYIRTQDGTGAVRS